MPGFLRDFGYEDPHLPGGYGISTTVQQLISSLVSAGMFVSTFFAGWICNKFGRRGGLWSGNALMIVSVTIQIAATQLSALYVGRLVLGFANGLLMVCAQLYMQETIPSNLRSLSYTFYQFWISFGALLGVIINNETTKRFDRSSYRIPLGVLYIIPVFQTVVLFLMPDTPRFYASQNKMDEANRALRFHRDAAYTDLQLKEEIAEIAAAIEADRQLTSEVGYLEMFRGPNVKRTLTSLGCGLFSAANGVPFIVQYGIYFFMLSGDHNPFQTGVILQCVGLVGAMLTPLFTGRVGKRAILMTGGFTQALCMMGVGVVYSVRGLDGVAGRVIIAMASIFLFIASATTSPYSWQVAGEIPSQRLRGHTLGFASSVTYLCGWSITFTIPYFINPTELNWVSPRRRPSSLPPSLLSFLFPFSPHPASLLTQTSNRARNTPTSGWPATSSSASTPSSSSQRPTSAPSRRSTSATTTRSRSASSRSTSACPPSRRAARRPWARRDWFRIESFSTGEEWDC